MSAAADGKGRAMKAMRCHGWGPPDSLQLDEFAPVPLGRREVRIRVHAAGVNFADTLMIAGSYQVKPEFPFVPGLEAAGEVIEIGGDVSELRPGHRVLAVGKPRMNEQNARLSLYCRALEPVGDGALLAEIEARRARLSADGLFDDRRKRPLPFWPRTIGLISGRDAAASRDVLCCWR